MRISKKMTVTSRTQKKGRLKISPQTGWAHFALFTFICREIIHKKRTSQKPDVLISYNKGYPNTKVQW